MHNQTIWISKKAVYRAGQIDHVEMQIDFPSSETDHLHIKTYLTNTHN